MRICPCVPDSILHSPAFDKSWSLLNSAPQPPRSEWEGCPASACISVWGCCSTAAAGLQRARARGGFSLDSVRRWSRDASAQRWMTGRGRYLAAAEFKQLFIVLFHNWLKTYLPRRPTQSDRVPTALEQSLQRLGVQHNLLPTFASHHKLYLKLKFRVN